MKKKIIATIRDKNLMPGVFEQRPPEWFTVKKELENLAENSGTNRAVLLNLALTNCLDVFVGSIRREGEEPDLFWMKEAGLRAGHLAELLEKWPQAINVYRKLQELVPAAVAKFDNDILRCRQRLSGVKPQELGAREANR